MTGKIDPGVEIRRIILLSRFGSAGRGRTLGQLVRECEKVAGWRATGRTAREVVLIVLQNLIDDGLVAVKDRFVLTVKGHDYLQDPLKWRIDEPTTKDTDQPALFWNAIHSIIYETVDRVVRRIRPGNIRSSLNS